jgi:hypothetical protein
MDQYPLGPPHFEHQTETVESPGTPGRWRRAAVVATGSFALAGAVAVGVVATGGSSGASPGAVTQESTTTTTVQDRPSADEREARRAEKLDEVLQPLVDDGTITDSQRDAVVKRLQEAAPDGRGPGGFGGFGHGWHLRGLFGAGLDTAAKALGITTDELTTELRAGKTIADVAGEKNVPVDTVIDALVAEAKAKIAEHDLPEGRTAPTDAEIRDAVTKLVNGELRFGRGGHGPGDHGPGDHDGPPADAPADAPAGDDTTTTTTN